MIERVGYCQHCAAEFRTKATRRVFCSDRCKMRYNRQHRLTCFYCGDLATDRDHITPHSARGHNKKTWKTDTVNACRECNEYLGNSHPFHLEARIGYLMQVFAKKNKLYKPMVEWDDDDLNTVGENLRKWIAAKQRQRVTDEQRLAHMRLRKMQVATYDPEALPNE